MPGMCYETSKWLDRLWSEHLEYSDGARELVKAGIEKQGEAFAGFPADIHARLYLPSDPPGIDPAPEWATRLHELASELGEWQRLRAMCSRNGFAAGIATESMLHHLLPLVPDRPPAQPSGLGGSQPGGDQLGNSQVDQGHAGTSQSDPGGNNQAQSSSGPSDTDLRAALRKAVRQARDAVQDAESSLEGLATPLGFSMPGNSVVRNPGPADMKAIRDAHSRLKDSDRLKRIAELAGRFERVAAAKARSKVKPGVGEVHGVSLGGLDELARILPSELVTLRHPKLRTVLMARLLLRQALVYSMKGREPQARGPIVVLLDESDSMNDYGKDIWAKAVCLALLNTATRQKRAWHLVAFQKRIVREVAIPAGRATPADIQEALDHRCSGGTDLDEPVIRAIEIIKTSPTMKQADVVVITDGEASLEHSTVNEATELTRTEGVSWFVVGVGPAAETICARSLEPIATHMVHVARLDEAEPIVDVINLDRKEVFPHEGK